MNFAELLERLRHEDEVTLLELLEINSEDLVDNFADRIQEHMSRLIRHYDN